MKMQGKHLRTLRIEQEDNKPALYLSEKTPQGEYSFSESYLDSLMATDVDVDRAVAGLEKKGIPIKSVDIIAYDGKKKWVELEQTIYYEGA